MSSATEETDTDSSSGKVVCLVSGGIDSPVAAWLVIRRGCTPVFIYYDNYPFTGDTTKRRALDTIKEVRKHSAHPKLKTYIIPHGPDLADILRNCPRRLTCILCRRMMYRMAKRVAELEEADAIVTGEIIGEHASQTVTNLQVESTAVTDVCILRPLIAMNKLDVERLARKIGTFQISTRPGLCCSAPPKSPRTRATIEEVETAEERLDLENMIERDLKDVEVLEV